MNHSTQSTEPRAHPANLALRLLCALYDALPLLALWFVAATAALAFSGGGLEVRRPGDRLLVQLLVLLVTAAYFVLSWVRGGQTVGMRPWRLRVVRADGAPLDTAHAILRFCVALLSLGACGIGLLWCLVDRDRRAWHDIAAGTLLVRIDKAG
ncbi:MAG: RDD family protein [Rudaea sp.]